MRQIRGRAVYLSEEHCQLDMRMNDLIPVTVFLQQRGWPSGPLILWKVIFFPERGRRVFGKKENQKNFSFSSLQYRISVLKCESVTGSDPWGLLKELEDT